MTGKNLSFWLVFFGLCEEEGKKTVMLVGKINSGIYDCV
jgi:hypothetical protein